MIIFWSVTLTAQGQETLSQQRAIEIALRNNYGIAIAGNSAEIAGNNASLGNAGFLPTLDLTAGGTKSTFNTKQEFASGGSSERDGAKTTAINGAVTLSWTIFDGFNMFAAKSRFNALRDIGEINAKIAVESTVAQIITSYNNIIQQQQLLEALADAIAISTERASIAEANYRIGTGSRLEWNRAKVDLIADSSAYLRQEAIWSNGKVELNRLLARNAATQFDITDSIRIDLGLDHQTLLARARQDNNALKVAQQNIGLARSILRAARSERFPVIALNAGYDYSRTESDAGFFLFNRNQRFNYGITVRMNLFDGFNTHRKEQNAKLDILNSELDYRDLETIVEADLAMAYKRYQTSLEVVQLEEENVQLARQNVEIAVEQFRLGSITSIDFREVQNNFVDTEARFIAAQLEAKLAETELLRLSGQLVR